MHAKTAPKLSLDNVEKSSLTSDVAPVWSSCVMLDTAYSPRTRRHMYSGAPVNLRNISLTLTRIALSFSSSRAWSAAGLGDSTGGAVAALGCDDVVEEGGGGSGGRSCS